MAITGGSTQRLSGTAVSSYLVFNTPAVQSTQLREWLSKELVEAVCGPEFKPLIPCKRGEWPYLCDFFWVDKNGLLLTPDKKPVTDKCSTHIQAGGDTSLLGLHTGVWTPRRHTPHWKTYCTLGNDSQRLNLWICRAFMQPHRWRSPPGSP